MLFLSAPWSGFAERAWFDALFFAPLANGELFMALAPCPECRQPVSDAAVACPKCGYPLSAKTEFPRSAAQAAPQSIRRAPWFDYCILCFGISCAFGGIGIVAEAGESARFVAIADGLAALMFLLSVGCLIYNLLDKYLINSGKPSGKRPVLRWLAGGLFIGGILCPTGSIAVLSLTKTRAARQNQASFTVIEAVEGNSTVRLLLPPGWGQIAPPQGGLLAASSKTGAVFVWRDNKPVPQNVDLEGYVNDLVLQLTAESAWRDFRPTSANRVMVSGLPALRAEFLAINPVGNIEMHFLEVALQTDSAVYLVEVTLPEAEWINQSTQLSALAESLRVVETSVRSGN